MVRVRRAADTHTDLTFRSNLLYNTTEDTANE
jgi:hypothetical protein